MVQGRGRGIGGRGPESVDPRLARGPPKADPVASMYSTYNNVFKVWCAIQT